MRSNTHCQRSKSKDAIISRITLIPMSLFRPRQGFWWLNCVALLIAIAWRAEVELRGWEGLTWLSYYHLAIAIGVGLFAAWLARYSNLPDRQQRLRLAGLFVLAFVPLYELLKFSLSLFFSTGPSAFALAGSLGFQLFAILRLSIFLVYPGILFLFWIAAQKFGLHLDRRTRLLSAGLYLGAWLLAVLIAPLTGVPPDAIHTIKSGNLLLFMTVGLGIPFLALDRPSLK
jgi:hypothetical protein